MSYFGPLSSSNSQPINYIFNGKATDSTLGWVTYSGLPSSRPESGLGGSANVTFTRNTTNPLSGNADFVFIKDAVNRQGQGASFGFILNESDVNKVLTVSFDYTVLSGTYSTGDLTVYLVQDPSAAGSGPVITQPAGFQIQSITSGNTTRHIATFQLSKGSFPYGDCRLCFHVASISASAYSLAIDNIVLGPQIVQYGAPVTDWQAYTPTFNGFGTVSAVAMFWRRIGDSIEIQGKFTSGTTTAVEARVSFPAGTTSAGADKIPTIRLVGQTQTNTTTGSGISIFNTLVEPSVTYLTFGYRDSANLPLTKQLGTLTGVNGQATSLYALVPIAGWSSTVQMSNDTDTRVVAARASGDPASATSGNPIIFPTTAFDTHGAYNSSTGRYTVSVPGFYRISGAIIPGTGGAVGLFAYVNAVSVARAGNTDSNTAGVFTALVQVNAGDLIDIRPNATLDAGSGSVVNFERLSGPSAIAASETVAARYTNTAGTSVPSGGAGAGLVPVPFATRAYDSHGFFNGSTGVGTIPIAGTYRISCSFYFQAQLWTAIGKAVAVRKNGTIAGYLAIYTPASASTIDLGLVGVTEVRFNAGDTFDLNLWHNEASARTLSALAEVNQITISRIGN